MDNRAETERAFYFPGDEDPWVAGLFRDAGNVWEGVPRIAAYIDETIAGFDASPGPVPAGLSLHAGMIYADAPVRLEEDLFLPDLRILIRAAAAVEPGVVIKAGALIGAGAEIRQGAYLRGEAIVADGAVVGHVTEVKNSVFFAGAEAGHFAYVGDSLLGRRVNLGAGTKLANLQLRTPEQKAGREKHAIVIEGEGRRFDTGLRKLGAVLGDDVEIGCNAVTSPGTLVGPRTWIYSNAAVRKGFYPADAIVRPESRGMDIIPKK
ncbi:MAG: glucose-1-phosphate thymidylyltransferase [Nitrospinota bacterium]|jgi:acetyltransferase-like isoleucine patch superfamily enzyme|nr:glucose-1-phosphate thymidylyltransferase [Nitrospinota bacterium]HJM42626.1 glucose-1-phosphate thymidylyltransferase [Nitrospinota bacterium]